jgi:hypothetical protein
VGCVLYNSLEVHAVVVCATLFIVYLDFVSDSICCAAYCNAARVCLQVDDMVLSTARHEGTRDGATALVLLRLGNALYAAHAGECKQGHWCVVVTWHLGSVCD